VVADIVADALRGLKMRFPKSAVDMDVIRKKFHDAEMAT
jgi:hypothetical protein